MLDSPGKILEEAQERLGSSAKLARVMGRVSSSVSQN